jgi:hypothetical protein
MRVPSSWTNYCVGADNQSCIFFDFWMTAAGTTCNSPCSESNVELDFVEMYGPGPGGGNGTSSGGGNPQVVATYQGYNCYDQHDTYGALQTVRNDNSGADNYAGCWILNEVSPSVTCGSVYYDLVSIIATPTMEFYPGMVGPQKTDDNCGPGGRLPLFSD